METTSLGAEGDGTWSEGREKASTPTTSVQTTGESEQAAVTTEESSVRGESASHTNEEGTTEGGAGGAGASIKSMESDKTTASPISIRMIMGSKDVGSIIGKAGMTIKAFREKSGAKINISNGTSSERLVTLCGTKDQVCKAFSAISSKIEEDTQIFGPHTKSIGIPSNDADQVGGGGALGVVSIRLIIQTSQCGSLIGKGGSRIKEIREATGASIQIAGESLPNSTERAVTVSGLSESISRCVEYICDVILESPPKGPSVPYKPHPLSNQPYQPRPGIQPFQTFAASFNTTAQPATTIQHMRIPNDLIGCVIGRKGTKIHEIRVNSGAMIKIASNEGDGSDRLVTITGTPESVGIAQYLINSRIHSEVNSYLSIGTLTNV